MKIVSEISDYKLENGRKVYNTVIKSDNLLLLYQDNCNVGDRYNTDKEIKEICSKINSNMIELYKAIERDDKNG